MLRRTRSLPRDPRLQAILESALEAIIIIDEQGIIDTFNRAAQRMFGYDAAEVVGRSVGLLMPEPSRGGHEARIAKYISNGRSGTHGLATEVTARRKDGSTFPATVAAGEFRLGSQRAFAGIVRDVSAQRALEGEILTVSECEQRRVGRELHEGLCQELAGVAMLANSMQRKLTTGGAVTARDAEELATVTASALRHARSMARGLDPVATVPFGLAAALAQLASDTGDASGVECRFHHPTPVEVADPLVAFHLYRIAHDAVREAVRGHARQILINLLQNPDGLELSVCDDGTDGIGSAPCVLQMMAHRTRTIGATLARAGEAGVASDARVVCRLPGA